MITCSNWWTSALTGQRSRTCGTSSVTFSPIRRLSRTVRSESASPRSSTTGRMVCLRENASSCRTRLAARLAFCLICMMSCHDVVERRFVRLVRFCKETGPHLDAAGQIVEVVGDVAGEPADGLHLVLLVDVVLECALLRGLERVDDHRLALALGLVLDGCDE